MKKGFTILELLVVISVLVILIGIAIPRFKGMQDAGKIAQVKAELKTFQTALESYRMNSTAYPASGASIGATLTGSTPQIISSVLIDPFASATDTQYNYVLNGAYYVISSVGAGGSGTAGTISTAGVVTTALSVICRTNGTGC
jgi:general secretion pathway protein G